MSTEYLIPHKTILRAAIPLAIAFGGLPLFSAGCDLVSSQVLANAPIPATREPVSPTLIPPPLPTSTGIPAAPQTPGAAPIPIRQDFMTLRPSRWPDAERAVQKTGWTAIQGEGQALGPNLFIFAPQRTDVYGQSIALVIGDNGQVRNPMDISTFDAETETRYPVTRIIVSEGKSGTEFLKLQQTLYFTDAKRQALATMIVNGKVADNFLKLQGADGKPYIAYTDWAGKIWGVWDIRKSSLSLPGDKNFPLAEKQPVAIASLNPQQLLGDLINQDSFISQVSNAGDVDFYLGRAPLPGYGWSIKNEKEILIDARGALVATLDQKGGVRWDSAQFALLNRYIKPDATPADRATFTKFLKENRFVIFDAAPDNGKTPPPSVIILDENGNIKAVQGTRGVTDFAYDGQNQRLMGIWSDGRAWSYYDSEKGAFVLDREKIKQIFNDKKVEFRFPDNNQKKLVEEATVAASEMALFGYSPDEVNALFNKYAAREDREDFRNFFDTKWQSKYPRISFDILINKALSNNPDQLYRGLKYIGQSDLCNGITCWYTESWNYLIEIAPYSFRPNNILALTIYKELEAAKFMFEAFKLGVNNPEDLARIGEHMSFVIKASARAYHYGDTDPEATREDIKQAYKGGIVILPK